MSTTKLNRREFLLWLGLGGLTLNKGFDLLKEKRDNRLERQIYNLSKDVHIAEYSADSDGGERKNRGVGIFLDDHYISVNHIPEGMKSEKVRTGFGYMHINYNLENRKMTINDKPLDILVEDHASDMLIAKQRVNTFFNFPCDTSNDIKYGDNIYIIGNPELEGTNIRQGKISDLDGFADSDWAIKENTFGIDIPVHPGDSGSPIVNDKFQLLGLAQYVACGKFGYVSKIGQYEDKIKELKYVVEKKINEK